MQKQKLIIEEVNALNYIRFLLITLHTNISENQ